MLCLERALSHNLKAVRAEIKKSGREHPCGAKLLHISDSLLRGLRRSTIEPQRSSALHMREATAGRHTQNKPLNCLSCVGS